MKIFTSLFTLFAVLVLFAFKGKDKKPDQHEEIIQLALQENFLKNNLKKGPDGEYLPVVLITNNRVSTDLHLNFSGQELILVSNIGEAQALGEEFSFIELKEVNIKKRKGKLLFQLGEYKIKVKLKNDPHGWRRTYFSAIHFDIEL